MLVKQFKEHDCWAKSQQTLWCPNMVGYRFVSFVHRNGHRYYVEQCQYIRKNELFFRILPPEDETVPYKDIFLHGNGIRVGLGTKESPLLQVQHKDIKSIEVEYSCNVNNVGNSE